jgi:hypothetical protein
MDKRLAQFDIVHGQLFDYTALSLNYTALSLEKKAAMGIAVKAVQRNFGKIINGPGQHRRVEEWVGNSKP